MPDDDELMSQDCRQAVDIEDAHVREVYARFGLAMYFAQVLEHAIVNAITILDLIPNKRYLALDRTDWESQVDSFMDRQFEATMGRMLRTLKSVTTIDSSWKNCSSKR